MKKTYLIIGILSALILASCASPAGSSNDDPAGTGTAAGNQKDGSNNSTVNYKLTIDSNIPSSPYNNYYVHTYYYNEKIELQGSTITLPQTDNYFYDYSYDNSNYYTLEKTFTCTSYNTEPDGSGTVYNFGNTITLTKDTTLYCQYSITYESKAGEENESNENSGNDSESSITISEMLTGTWKCSDSSYTGTLTLNANGTGYINVILAGNTAHDSSLSWSIRQSNNSKDYLVISGVNDGSQINGSHYLESVTSSKFIIDGSYFAFGMPKRTVWYKQ